MLKQAKVSIIVIFFLTSICFSAKAFILQDSLSLESRMRTAKDQIQAIKKYGLLLRLNSYERAKQTLSRNNNTAALQKLEKEERKSDQEILKAFQDQFTFCKVYYFKDKDTERVLAGDYSVIQSLDGQPSDFQGKELFIIDPYMYPANSTGNYFSGVSLRNAQNNVLQYPMPMQLARQRGPFSKSYSQLVYDWNNQFLAMYELAQIIQDLDARNALNNNSAEKLKRERKELFRSYKKNRANRPK